jgi:hypothetical protein
MDNVLYLSMMKFDPHWQEHLTQTWQSHLRQVPTNSTILEVAPGGTNKIGLALARLGFTGRIILVEPELDALNKTANAYRSMMPRATVVPLQQTLGQALTNLPSNLITVANHPLDDMIIGNTLKGNDFDSLFFDHYTQSVDLTKNLWDKLHTSQLEAVSKVTFDEWEAIIHRSSQVYMSQYDSYFFATNDFTRPDREAFNLLRELRNRFNGKSISGQFVEDETKWMKIA